MRNPGPRLIVPFSISRLLVLGLLLVFGLGAATYAQDDDSDPLDTDPLQANVQRVAERKQRSLDQALSAPSQGMQIYENAAKGVGDGGGVPQLGSPTVHTKEPAGFPWLEVVLGTFVVVGGGYLVIQSLRPPPPRPEPEPLPSMYPGPNTDLPPGL